MSTVSGGLGATADWSPDGSRVLLASNNALFTVSTQDGSITTLQARAPHDLKPCSETLSNPIWSPNGRWIAYEDKRCVKEERDERPYAYTTIEIIHPDGRFEHSVSDEVWGFLPYDSGIFGAVWSPDSRFLVFIDDAYSEYFLAKTSLSKPDWWRLRAGVYSAPAWQQLQRPRT